MGKSAAHRNSPATSHAEDPIYGALRNKVGLNLTDAEEAALRYLTEKEATYVPGSKRRMGIRTPDIYLGKVQRGRFGGPFLALLPLCFHSGMIRSTTGPNLRNPRRRRSVVCRVTLRRCWNAKKHGPPAVS